jgi:hypothetical protein
LTLQVCSRSISYWKTSFASEVLGDTKISSGFIMVLSNL